MLKITLQRGSVLRLELCELLVYLPRFLTAPQVMVGHAELIITIRAHWLKLNVALKRHDRFLQAALANQYQPKAVPCAVEARPEFDRSSETSLGIGEFVALVVQKAQVEPAVGVARTALRAGTAAA